METKTLTAAVFLVVLWTVEGLLPFYEEFDGRFRDRIRHDARNLLLGACNALLTALVFGGAFVMVERWGDAGNFGLFRVLEWPGWLELALVFLLFDFWMYLWHRVNHRIPFLWRFHRMHHSDPDMDVSTGVRFHPGELILSSLARLAIIPLLGMELWQLAIYEAVLLPVILFHHSNVRIPRWMDHGLLALVVTPAMHRVHHSRWQPETDSNYGSVFPWWDMALRTFRLREDAGTIQLGLEEFDEQEWQSLTGLLKTPLAANPWERKAFTPSDHPPGPPPPGP
ncbi:MAG: sterol desaturase family protein [Gemmatimonadota bacterium]